MKVKSVQFNWFYTAEDGDGYEECEIGTVWGYKETKKTVVEIKHHPPQRNGDRPYCDIEFDNGEIYRTYNINNIVFEKELNNE